MELIQSDQKKQQGREVIYKLLVFINSNDQTREARIWRGVSRNMKYIIWNLARDTFPYRKGGYAFGCDFDQYPKEVRECIKAAVRELAILTIYEFGQAEECETMTITNTGNRDRLPRLSA
jgi:hypothetical protein